MQIAVIRSARGTRPSRPGENMVTSRDARIPLGNVHHPSLRWSVGRLEIESAAPKPRNAASMHLGGVSPILCKVARVGSKKFRIPEYLAFVKNYGMQESIGRNIAS